jgi:hypothetical protein
MYTKIIILFLLLCTKAYADNVTLAWDGSPDPVTGYTVFYGEQSVLTNPSTPIVTDSLARQLTIKGLTTGKRYYFALKAFYYNNWSGWSNEVNCLVEGHYTLIVPEQITGFYFSNH